MKYVIYRNGTWIAAFESRAIRDDWFWTLPLESVVHLYTRGAIEEVMVS